MTIEAKPDPYAQRYKPDSDLVALAHNQMLKEETEVHRFVRQRYEETIGALRVALQGLREIYPSEHHCLSEHALDAMAISVRAAEEAFVALGTIESEMLGEPMSFVLRGVLGSIEEFREYVDFWEED